MAATPEILITVEGAEETLTLNVPETAPHKIFTLENPDRLVVDVPTLGLTGHRPLALPGSYTGKMIKGVRMGRFDKDTTRFVFDLERPAKVLETEIDKGQIVIIIAPGKGSSKVIESKAKEPDKPMIVIDAGHGGVDPGTIGGDGTREKDIVLIYAKVLAKKLEDTGRYRVALTRFDDRFIALRDRVAIARKQKASLFISLHADSAHKTARGLSVYTVSEKASDEEAAALAARENKADVLAGMDLSEEREDVAGILISLAQRETNNRSATLADFLVQSLQGKIDLLPKTHRFAGFAVLKAPDIPSVLIELGFLSHRGDQKLLKSKSHRDKVVGGIVSGIDAFFKHKQKMDDE